MIALLYRLLYPSKSASIHAVETFLFTQSQADGNPIQRVAKLAQLDYFLYWQLFLSICGQKLN